MIQEGSILDSCNAKYQEVLKVYNLNTSGKIILSHFGELTQELVNSISVSIEEQMKEGGDKKSIVKRMFSILVEAMQNIRIHGERDEKGLQTSFLTVLQSPEYYKLTLSNLVKTVNVSKIVTRIDQLNELEFPDIKNLYMEVLSNGIMSNKGGAGLGFITMSLKSKNKLILTSEKVTENLTLQTLEVKLDRAIKS
jgi:hypothetical protein